tara:strand:- start:433 stop:642 length:210 start_codon:yes stop_codon:yes gene_type:complete
MTRKDYARIARSINISTLEIIDRMEFSAGNDYAEGMRAMRTAILKNLSTALAEDNPRFDFEKFRTACLA